MSAHYIPDVEAHERHDAEVMRMAHPPFHPWRTEKDGSTRCDWPGCTEATARATLSPNVTATTVQDHAFVVVDLFAKTAAKRDVLLAGPFDDVDTLRVALGRYGTAEYRPAVLYVSPVDYTLLAHGGQEARARLIDLTRQPEYEGMECPTRDAPQKERRHVAA